MNTNNKGSNLDHTPVDNSHGDYSIVNNYRVPTINNPMMNVPIVDYDKPQVFSNYFRSSSKVNANNVNTSDVKQEINKTFNNKLFQDPADFFFNKNNSQRQWYSMPNGSVPSDQQSFAESLYGREYVCKGGSIWMRYGVPYTDDSLACTGFEGDGQVTNFGSLNNN